MKELKRIPINIWDDFYLETFIYVDCTEISHEKCKECLEILLEYINKNLNTDDVKLWLEFYESKNKYPNLIGTEYEYMLFSRYEIKVKGLTHERLNEWMEILTNVDIKIDGITFDIYSES